MTAENLNDPKYSQNSKLISAVMTKNSMPHTERHNNEQVVSENLQVYNIPTAQ